MLTITNEDNMAMMARYPDKHFELAIVDPPYRDSADNQPTKDMRANGTMRNFGDKPTELFFTELFRISKNQIIWGANNFQLPPYKGFVIWKKKTISDTFTMSMAEMDIHLARERKAISLVDAMELGLYIEDNGNGRYLNEVIKELKKETNGTI